MNVIIRSGALNVKLEELRSQLQADDALHFSSYEELADYCYPFSKNLANGITDGQKYWLLYYIADFFHQQVLMYRLIGICSLFERCRITYCKRMVFGAKWKLQREKDYCFKFQTYML